ncbi:hypothetical protein LTR85_005166 [Meristemomyces frigidus]|nr:hypothetical protein LTR85_005166 [Meristemomyces frigidus]
MALKGRAAKLIKRGLQDENKRAKAKAKAPNVATKKRKQRIGDQKKKNSKPAEAVTPKATSRYVIPWHYETKVLSYATEQKRQLLKEQGAYICPPTPPTPSSPKVLSLLPRPYTVSVTRALADVTAGIPWRRLFGTPYCDDFWCEATSDLDTWRADEDVFKSRVYAAMTKEAIHAKIESRKRLEPTQWDTPARE